MRPYDTCGKKPHIRKHGQGIWEASMQAVSYDGLPCILFCLGNSASDACRRFYREFL